MWARILGAANTNRRSPTMDDATKARIVEAGALAIINEKRRRFGFDPLLDMTAVNQADADANCNDARAVAAAMRAAQAAVTVAEARTMKAKKTFQAISRLTA
jgi:hypothetical protein